MREVTLLPQDQHACEIELVVAHHSEAYSLNRVVS